VTYKIDISKCLSFISVGHGSSEIAVFFLDKMRAPSVIFEWQLRKSASLEDSKQGKIENLEDLGCLRCERNEPHTGSREKINLDGSEVR
jgi:hypothetical protein